MNLSHRLFYALAVFSAAWRTIVKRFPGFEVEITFPAAMMTTALLAQALTPLREINALADESALASGVTIARS